MRSAHVVATSYGGYFALRGAAACPDRVDRMVQCSWPVGARAARVPTVVRLAVLPGLRRLGAVMPATERGVRMLFRQLGHADSLKDGRITPEMIDWFLHLWLDEPDYAAEAVSRFLGGREPRTPDRSHEAPGA